MSDITLVYNFDLKEALNKLSTKLSTLSTTVKKWITFENALHKQANFVEQIIFLELNRLI